MSAQPPFAGPLYEQVHDLLRSRVLAGEWSSGVPLPGEVHLSKELGVSIGTVRKAMDKLASERMVVRQRGRGTFIANGSGRAFEPTIRLYSSSGQPLEIAISKVDSAVRAPTSFEAETLQTRRRGRNQPGLVITIQRVWYADKRSICRETITVDESRFPTLASNLPSTQELFFEHYAQQFGIAVARVSWMFQPISDSIAWHDQADSGKPALNVGLVRTAYDTKGNAIEICEQILSLKNEIYRLDRTTV